MYRPARQPWLRQLEETSRERPGLATAPAALSGVRQMIRALRKGESVGLLPDQVPPEGMGVWAPFYRQPAYTMTLAARLVQQTGAALLLAWGRAAAAGPRLPAADLPADTAAARHGRRRRGIAAGLRQRDQHRDGAADRAMSRPVPVGLQPLQAAAQGACGHRRRGRSVIGELSARALLGVLWLFQHLPLGVQAALGRGLGRLLHALAGGGGGWRCAMSNCACPNWTRRAAAPGARAFPVAGAQHSRARLALVCTARAAEDADPRRGRRRLAERSERR